MANCGKDILKSREGTQQKQCFIDVLDPAFVKLNDFELKDWMQFAYDFASHVNYFGVQNDQIPLSDWHDFFKSETELDEFLKEVETGSEITPHLALFVVFVKLLEISKQRFNGLTKRHLDFYYRQVLQIQKEPATPDKVHVLFELAKNAVSEKIGKESELDGGKDTNGKKLIYKTTEELIANQTKVAQLKSVYNDHDYKKLKAAEFANSFDGAGGDFPDNEVKWWPFGYYEVPPDDLQNDTREYPDLADANDAKIGFALAGKILEMNEGERNVKVSLNFSSELLEAVSAEELIASLEMYCTGEKGWLGPFPVKEQVLDAVGDILYSSGSDTGDEKTVNLVFQIPKDEKAIVKYNSKVHGERFVSDYPVCRILLKTGKTEAHELYRKLVEKQLSAITIKTNVRGVVGLNLYNDVGVLNAGKPFYPFGTQPVKKSKFYIDYAELYQKKWDDLSINIEWKNTPNDFKTWYYAYRDTFVSEISPNAYLNGIGKFSTATTLTAADEVLVVLKDKNITETVKERLLAELNTEKLLEVTSSSSQWQIVSDPDNLIVEDDSHFTANVEIKEAEEWNAVSGKNNVVLFDKQDDGLFELQLSVSSPNSLNENIGPVRLSINQTFLHEMYPRLYALAMSSDEETAIIPNEPYTPFVEQITLDYNASASIEIDLTKQGNYGVKDFELFHEHPFGQTLECVNAKLANGILAESDAQKLYVLPSYCKGGELFIGLEKAQAKQNVSLLIQVLEGSENPDAESFVGKQKVEWWMLCNNEWKELDSTAIISNDTDNFLKSGILKFTIPKEATDDNTVLPAGYMWLKARIHKKYNAVSKTIGIHAQAVVAGFSDNKNNLDHLNAGLPGDTISKMVNRIPKVKSVSQPYNSFGGQAEENDAAYYRRISERLRHKNRAINSWDYEHLVLQNFPEIHKVKCLSHTCSKVTGEKRVTKYLAPGSLVLVVIPDIVNKNVFDIYQPRVSKTTLNTIQEFLGKLNSKLVQTVVMNPEYEELRIALKVQFHSGYDNVYYKTVLQDDLTRLLSPWAFDTAAEIQFGISLHKSIIVNYVEQLEYVDFISDVKLFQKNAATGVEAEVTIALPSSPEAILVSSKQHQIEDANNTCLNIDIEPAESCQI
jgi:hypothetical protein